MCLYLSGNYLDVILLLDVSRDGEWGSYGKYAALAVLDSIRSDISLQHTHVSIVTVSDGDSRNSAAEVDILLNEEASYNYDDLRDYIQNIRTRNYGNNVDFYAGFREVSDVILRSSRNNINKLVVFISSVSTSQVNRDDAVREATNLHNSGYFVYGIYAERRSSVNNRDAQFMEDVVNMDVDNIQTESEFAHNSGFFCDLISCDGSK